MVTSEDESIRTKGRLRGWRALVAVLASVLVPLGIAAGVWLASAEHPPLPGMRGCTYVRERAAQIECYTDRFSSLEREHGLQRSLDIVDERARTSVTLGSDCHVAWHPVGERAGAADARDGGGYDNITAQTTCQQGYAHGYTIGYMGERAPTPEELARFVESDCSASDDVNALLNCVHAYGHVIARRFEGRVGPAVEACGRIDYSALPGTDSPALVPGEEPPILVGVRHQCLYGLYMEVSLLQLSDGDRAADNCRRAPSEHARIACYAYLPSRVNDITGSLREAARSCSRYAPRGEPREWCVRMFSIGLPTSERCSYLPARSEQATCEELIELRTSPEAIAKLTLGDASSFRGDRPVAPAPGIEPPTGGPGLTGADTPPPA